MRPFVRAFQLALMFRQGFQDDGISLHGGIFVEFAGESEFLLAMLKMCVYDGVGGVRLYGGWWVRVCLLRRHSGSRVLLAVRWD